MGKDEIASNKQFLLFPQCFLLNQTSESPFVYIFDIISLFAAEFEKPKIGISGKGKKTTFLFNTIEFWSECLNDFLDKFEMGDIKSRTR